VGETQRDQIHSELGKMAGFAVREGLDFTVKVSGSPESSLLSLI
jgi:hypothetical protein